MVYKRIPRPDDFRNDKIGADSGTKRKWNSKKEGIIMLEFAKER